MNSRSEEILCPYCGEKMQFPEFVGWMHSPPAGGGYNWHQCGECPNCGANSPKGYGRTLEEAKEAARAAAMRRYTPPIAAEKKLVCPINGAPCSECKPGSPCGVEVKDE